MRRRQYLAGLATGFSVSIAGCNTTSNTEQTTAEVTSTPSTTAQALPDIELTPGGLDENDTDGVPDMQAEAIVENPSDQPLTGVQVRARWYNEDGYLLGDDTSSTPILPAGERWSTWVYPFSVDVEEIENVELSASYSGLWPGSAPGVVVEESEMEEVETAAEGPQDAYRVRGLATNETGGMASLTVIALLRNDDGTVLYASSASQEAVPAGDTWTFDMGWEVLVRWALVDDYTLYTQSG